MRLIVLKEVKNINFIRYLSYQSILKALYTERKSSDPNYTYEKMSIELGFNKSPYILQIIGSIRPLTLKAAEKLCENLKLSLSQKKYFLNLVVYQNAKKDSDRFKALNNILEIFNKELPKDQSGQLDFISDWKNIVVKELMCIVPTQKIDEESIKNLVFPLTYSQVEKSLGILQKADIIEFDLKKKCFVLKRDQLNILGSEIGAFVSTHFHYQMLELATKALTRVPSQLRQFEAISLSVKEENIQKMRQKVNQFIDQLIDEFHEAEDPNQVMQCNVQLFPHLKEPIK